MATQENKHQLLTFAVQEIYNIIFSSSSEKGDDDEEVVLIHNVCKEKELIPLFLNYLEDNMLLRIMQRFFFSPVEVSF